MSITKPNRVLIDLGIWILLEFFCFVFAEFSEKTVSEEEKIVGEVNLDK